MLIEAWLLPDLGEWTGAVAGAISPCSCWPEECVQLHWLFERIALCSRGWLWC